MSFPPVGFPSLGSDPNNPVKILPSDRVFLDSPDAGDPECFCSRCGLPISEDDVPIRAWPEDGRYEWRYHTGCLGFQKVPEEDEFPEGEWDPERPGEDEAEYTESDKLVLEKGTCCICEKPLSSSKYVNMGLLNKKTTWKDPSWGNVLIPGSMGRAVFYVCDTCQESSEKGIEPGPVKYAVEVRDGNFILHPVEELEDVPPITEVIDQ